MSEKVIRLKPLEYVHVHDGNTSVTKLIVGPCTYTVPPHEALASKGGASPFICVKPRHYVTIENPVIRKDDGSLALDKHGQIATALGEKEIRFEQEPFPLYPGESAGEIKPLTVLEATQALVLRAAEDFEEVDQDTGAVVKRHAGDEWLLRGPGTYTPLVQHELVAKRDATIVRTHEALRLRAKNKHVDAQGVERAVGEEYLWQREGAYLLSVDEQLVEVVKAKILTPQLAVHVEATKEFVDNRPWAKGVKRSPGVAYRVTNTETCEFTPTPYEKVLKDVSLTIVSKSQYAVVLDPVVAGKQHHGRRQVITNCRVFLYPGERLEKGVQDAYVLGADEAIVLTAIEEFMEAPAADAAADAKPQKRQPGDAWLVRGPIEYIPHASVRVVKDRNGRERRKRVVLAEGEGVYIRNTQTGEIRAQIGGAVMLAATEELWEKELPPIVEEKLAQQGESFASYMEKHTDKTRRRDKTRVVRYAVPHNAVCQVYDYKKRTQRTLFGPDAVLLGPEEQFTVLSLSGSDWDPKRPNVCLPKQADKIKSLFMFLGPATLSDVLEVETCDHARLELQLSYDWVMDVTPGNTAQADECFSVPDFVGDCCSCIASRIRASVAGVSFDDFHKHSASIVQTAVFGTDPDTREPRAQLRFPSNRLVVTSVDVQDMSVLDEKTRIALQQSVKRAIQNTTDGQESAARQEASVRQQQAQGMLDRQVIADKAEAERHRKALIELETSSAAIAGSGVAKAEARARSEASVIEAESTVELARVRATTQATLDNMSVEGKRNKTDADLEYRRALEVLELTHQKQLTGVDSGKFSRTINAMGRGTVIALARAGPEAQARLLKSMGLQGYLVTDGTNPINLFNAASGMTQAGNNTAAALSQQR